MDNEQKFSKGGKGNRFKSPEISYTTKTGGQGKRRYGISKNGTKWNSSTVQKRVTGKNGKVYETMVKTFQTNRIRKANN